MKRHLKILVFACLSIILPIKVCAFSFFSPAPRDLLTQAIREGDEVNVFALIPNQVDIDENSKTIYKDWYWLTPLQEAIFFGNIDFARIFIDNGAKIPLGNYGSEDLMNLAIKSKAHLSLEQKKETISYLYSIGIPITRNAFEGALQQTHASEIIEHLISLGMDINDVLTMGANSTPLIEATRLKSIAMIDVLIKYGADLESRASNGMTPLIQAVIQESDELVQHFIDLGADVNGADNDGKTPVFFVKTSKLMLKRLIDSGADINLFNSYGCTPLMEAAAFGKIQYMKNLLDFGADPFLKTSKIVYFRRKTDRFDLFPIIEQIPSKSTAMAFAKFDGNVTCIELLKSAGLSE